jgi:hypothetical protein
VGGRKKRKTVFPKTKIVKNNKFHCVETIDLENNNTLENQSLNES